MDEFNATRPASGGVDTTARAVMRHLGGFMPGNPAITVQNTDGAAGIIGCTAIAPAAPSPVVS